MNTATRVRPARAPEPTLARWWCASSRRRSEGKRLPTALPPLSLPASEIEAAQRVGHTPRFLNALRLDGHTDLDLHGPAADLIDADDLRPGAHPRAAAHHARKAHPVTAVVELELHPLSG